MSWLLVLEDVNTHYHGSYLLLIKIDQVYTAPGNGGTSQNIELSVNDIEGLAKFAQEKNCFTVVGPEDPLAAGIVDAFIEKGLPVFGPTQNAAQLESSKNLGKRIHEKKFYTYC